MATAFTVISPLDQGEKPSVSDLKGLLEKSSEESKIEAMKTIIIAMLNGEPHDQLLMHVIRFVMPSRNKKLKKLLHYYWEICPKTHQDGKLKQEMILVCNALRNDLQHPNEYIRGSTLRFLCKLREPELLEPLVPTIRSCLEHRHSYVRKNAVFAIFSTFKHFEYLIPDAPELIQGFLAQEADTTCKRNALLMLTECKQDLAVEWVKNNYAGIAAMDELLQLAIIDLIRKDFHTNETEKAKFLRCITELLNSASAAVQYEAASTLVVLTPNPIATKASASCFLDLANKESDNNVKLIVLDRFNLLRQHNERVLDECIMDLLRVLSSPDIDVKKKVMQIALEMLNSRNIEEVVGFLKKELLKTSESKGNEYQQLLIQSIHRCAIKFPLVAASVIHILLDHLVESSSVPATPAAASAVDVIAFVREVVEKFPDLRAAIIEKLLDAFCELRSSRVIRGALWILGEYSLQVSEIDEFWKKIREAIGTLPLMLSGDSFNQAAATAAAAEMDVASISSRRILPDGTYATESAVTSKNVVDTQRSVKTFLRSLLLSGDYFLGTVLASTLSKVIIRFSQLSQDTRRINSIRAEGMLIMTGILRTGKVAHPPIDEDSLERIIICLKVVDNPTDTVTKIFLEDCKKAFVHTIDDQQYQEGLTGGLTVAQQPDDLIMFRQFGQISTSQSEQQLDLDLKRASGLDEDDGPSKLKGVVQLTGFSDAVYAEAYVKVHQFDIFIDVLLVNQTNDTLRNLTIEFATLGDLKLVEKPSQLNLAPHGFASIKASIKVASTETGVIFGNIVYDGTLNSGSHCVILNDIHIDIMEYINPGTCSESQFRSMWTEFEWENKVNVCTKIRDLQEYLGYIIKHTNMKCLTPENALKGDCKFLSANLYAKSIFGEDALANLSIEQGLDGSLSGHIRIRSATQGIALSLGDKISVAQKVV